MTHPPIPPNCELFDEFPDYSGRPAIMLNGALWSCIDNEGEPCDGYFLDDDVPDGMRPIIAAMAEVAWRKVNEELLPDGSNADAIRAAFRNALAWREWGEERKEEKSKAPHCICCRPHELEKARAIIAAIKKVETDES